MTILPHRGIPTRNQLNQISQACQNECGLHATKD